MSAYTAWTEVANKVEKIQFIFCPGLNFINHNVRSSDIFLSKNKKGIPEDDLMSEYFFFLISPTSLLVNCTIQSA